VKFAASERFTLIDIKHDQVAVTAQMLAGHKALSTTTQRYIEWDVEAQKRVIDLV
jgi:hypothetical protein